MNEFFNELVDVAVVLFAVTSMLSVGLSYSLAEIVAPLRNVAGLVRALVANFVAVPAMAYLLTRVIPLDPPYAVGLLLISAAAGAPFLIKLTELADTDVALSATLLVVLLPVTIAYMPLVVPFIAPAADIDAWAIAQPLLMTMLLPLALGLLVKPQWPRLALATQPTVARLSTVSLIVLIVATVVVNYQAIAGIFGEWLIVAAVVFLLGAFAIGYLMGGSDPDAREVLGLGTGQRNIAAATVVATQSIGDADTLVMVVVVGVVGQLVLFPIATVLRRQERRRHSMSEI